MAKKRRNKNPHQHQGKRIGNKKKKFRVQNQPKKVTRVHAEKREKYDAVDSHTH